MNTISSYFVRHIVAVFFLYGLAFFVMGLALLFASRRSSTLYFARAILPLALFGLLHAAHEWIEMFQKVAALSRGYTPTPLEEALRVGVLVASFVMLLAFGLLLLIPQAQPGWRIALPIGVIVVAWLAGTWLVAAQYNIGAAETLAVADSLSRYSMAIPGAVLGTWALMAQQRAFREEEMPQFGSALVWCAAALLLFGAVGQLFVRETVLAPSALLNSSNFLQWFGIPVQLFRGAMAAVLTFFMVRLLGAFEVENRRRFEQANLAKLQAQEATLETERRTGQETAKLNEELRYVAHRLSLLLDLTNLLGATSRLDDRLHLALAETVMSLPFADAGTILLTPKAGQRPYVAASVEDGSGDAVPYQDSGNPLDGHTLPVAATPSAAWVDLGEQCMVRATALCLHWDGTVVAFELDEIAAQDECRRFPSPTQVVALPLTAQQIIIGAIVLARLRQDQYRLASAELALMTGIAQQLGTSVENALLHQEAQRRERVLAEVLRQVVGAQESERQRIARELHDATGQSLTAVALGLRGVEALLTRQDGDAMDRRTLAEQVRELQSFSTSALRELRQIISDLRPPQLDDLGLAAALRWYVQAYAQRRTIAAQFHFEGDEIRLPAEYKTVLFRIAQEALTNVAKHADATQVDISLILDSSQASLTVRDDGRGFDTTSRRDGDADSSGWGLLGIEERANLLGGLATVESSPGAGTQVNVTVPIPAPEERSTQMQASEAGNGA